MVLLQSRMIADRDVGARNLRQFAVERVDPGFIERVGGHVEKREARLGEQESGECDQLPFTDGEDVVPIALDVQRTDALDEPIELHLLQGFDDLFIGDNAHGRIEDELIAERAGDAVGLLREEHDFVSRGAFDRAGAILPNVSAHDHLEGALPAPTLIVWGSKDRMIPVSHALSVQRALPDCHVELFEGAGHFPHLEDPDRFARVLREFIAAGAEHEPPPVTQD